MANVITSGLLSAALTNKMINEAFDIARMSRTGILSTVGFGAAKRPYEGYKMSWLDAQVNALGSAIPAGATNVATALTVTTGQGSRFRSGMTFSVKGSDEVILVSSVAGDVLTVVRAFGGTTGAVIAAAAEIFVDSSSRGENSLAENDGIYQPETVENFFQTMDTAIEMSRRSLSTLQFGDTNNLQFQLQERLRQLAIQMDRALIRGRKAVSTVGGEERTYTGGMAYFTDQAGAIKVDNSAAALTLESIHNLNELVVKAGGNTNTLAVSVSKARKLHALISANYSSQRLAEWNSDQGSVIMLPSDLPLIGNVSRIVIDTNVQDNELYLYDSTMISIVPMESANGGEGGSWNTKDATQPGQDGERVRVIGDFGMEIRQSKTHMARLYNIG